MARFWTPEVEVDERLARELIATQFPQLEPIALRPFGAGMDNAAFLVNERYVFRFPRREIAVPLLQRETRMLPLLASRLPLQIPLPRFVGAPQGTYPWLFAGYERIDGTSACSVALGDEQRHAVAPVLGAFLRALHAIDTRPAAANGVPGDQLGRLDHSRRLPLARERFALLEDAGAINATQPFLAFMERVAPTPEDAGETLVHGDLYARHVLLDETYAPCGVIDWGDIHLGHPAIDLMVGHAMLPAAAQPAFVEAYGGVDARTWDLAKYRATYHCALVADFALQIGDAALLDAGLTGLRFIRETL
jgi:aminoglycoside phosphotransferase (APT) family kinase protein